MAPVRASTPPPSPVPSAEMAPKTPGHPIRTRGSTSVLQGAGHAAIPPSPTTTDEIFSEPALAVSSLSFNNKDSSRSTRKHKAISKTGAGVKKAKHVKKTPKVPKPTGPAQDKKTSEVFKAVKDYFPFLDLPGEIRNLIYDYTCANARQTLLVHRPRLARLRSSTRASRTRNLASDEVAKQQDATLALANIKTSKAKANTHMPRESHRPFVGLTQVCRQIRDEYRPIYMAKQEVGMDLIAIGTYLQTFYADAPNVIAALPPAGAGRRAEDASFNGNFTIAVAEKDTLRKYDDEGVEVFPLLDLWANSARIEAGFGRYAKVDYIPERDGEAKDLYRLFGRSVLPSRACTPMNTFWRSILRSRALSSVRILRNPTPRSVLVPNHPALIATGAAPLIEVMRSVPALHVWFKKEAKEEWMGEELVVPSEEWASARGFKGMEWFEVWVGAA